MVQRRSGRMPRHLIVVNVVLGVAAIAVLVWAIQIAMRPGPPDRDPDYDFGAPERCLNLGFATSTSAPYPAPGLTPVGQSVQVELAWFEVPQAAQTAHQAALKQARGEFVIVQVQEQYTGTAHNGLTTDPTSFQLVDRTGALHCAVQTPTDQLNQMRYPDIVEVGQPWFLRLYPGDPPSTLDLVFDLDPGMIQGAYLRAYNMTTTASVSLDLGLS